MTKYLAALAAVFLVSIGFIFIYPKVERESPGPIRSEESPAIDGIFESLNDTVSYLKKPVFRVTITGNETPQVPIHGLDTSLEGRDMPAQTVRIPITNDSEAWHNNHYPTNISLPATHPH